MDSDRHAEWIERARAGEADAMRQLLERHLAGLHAFVRVRLGAKLRGKESSSDLVQSVLADVLEDLGGERNDVEFRGEAAFRHWLFLRAEHKIVDRLRYYEREKRDVAREVPGVLNGEAGLLAGYGDVFTPSRFASAREELDRVERAFARLPEDYREVLLLTRIVGLSAEEVAERMQRSREAVWTLCSRALARLSTLLETPGDEGED